MKFQVLVFSSYFSKLKAPFAQHHNSGCPPTSIFSVSPSFHSFFLVQKNLVHKYVSSWSSLPCVFTIHIPSTSAWQNSPIWRKMEDSQCKCVFLSECTSEKVPSFSFFTTFFCYNFQSNLFPKKTGIFFFPLMFIPLIFQTDKFRNNWNIKGTRGITLYAFKIHEDYKVLYMKKADQSYFILSSRSKGKLQNVAKT